MYNTIQQQQRMIKESLTRPHRRTKSATKIGKGSASRRVGNQMSILGAGGIMQQYAQF